MPGRQDIEAGNAFVRLTLQDNAFIRSLSRNSERLKSFGMGMAKLGAGILGAGAALLTPLAGAVKLFADVASELDDISLRTGATVEFLSEVGHAAEQSGTDLATVEKSILKMQKILGADLSKGTLETLQDIGINAAELKKMGPEQQFETIAAAIAKIDDPAKKTAVAMELLGKSGAALIPVIDDLEELRQEARDLGFVMSSETAKDGAALGDMFDNLWKTVKYGVVAIGGALAPAVLKYGAIVQKVMTAGLKWIQDNKQIIVIVAAIAVGVTAAGLAITALGLTIAGVGVALGGIVTGLSALASVVGVVVSPLGLIAAALATGIYLWATYTESGQAAVGGLVSLLGDLWATAEQTFGGIYDALASGDLALAGKIAITGLQVALLQGLEVISQAIGGGFGDLLGTIGQQIVSGDLSGAWNTTVDALYTAWATFSEGLVSVFTTAMRAIADAWQSTTGAISDWILKNASKGGWLGKLLLVGTGGGLDQTRGIDPEKNAELERKRLALLGNLGVDATPANTDGLGQAQASARDQLKGQADSFRSKLDGIDASMQGRTRDANQQFKRSTAGGASGVSDAVAAAQAALDEATAAAAKAREEAEKEKEKKKQTAGDVGDITKLPDKVFSTFSATALQLAGVGSGDPKLTEAKKTNQKLDKQIEVSQETLGYIKANGASYT